jgi:transcriptional regulator with XRE-family HTH domain
MPETVRGIEPLNWPALVAEAIRRRKAEKMTQREHAALASVSVPTMIAFDRGERTLSLAKASDILRVVGLVEEVSDEGAQEIFVRDAFARWRELTAALPKKSPGRFPHGWYRIDYALEGDIRDIELHKFTGVLQKAVVRHTGWSMFWLPRRPELEAHEVDGVIECWLAPGDKAGFDRPFYDAAHCDFWRAAPSGRMLLIRGYQEDAQETFPPGTIFDTTLPIWRIGEAFLHAAKLASLIARDTEKATVRLRALYTGLNGRDLRAWASPMSVDYFGGGRSRTDEALLEGTAPAAAIDRELASFVYPLVSSLFERFGVTGISSSFVESELDRMRQNNFGEAQPELKG